MGLKAAGRRRGVGSITRYETKAGVRWRWQIRVPVDADTPELGSRQIGKGGYATAREADDSLQEARARMREHLAAVTAGGTVDSYSEIWLNGLRLANSTIHGYRKIFRNYVSPQLGGIRLDRLTATRLAKHYMELSTQGGASGRPLSANTINKTHVTVGAMLDAAVDDGLIASNPARKSRVVKAPTGKQIRAEAPEIVTWTASELRGFLDWDRDEYRDELHPLWHTIAHTGLRRSEALALHWGDIDMKGGRISVRRAADTIVRGQVKPPKTGRSRVVDIDSATVEVLRALKAQRGALVLDFARPGAYVFGNFEGEMMRPNNVTMRWEVRVTAARKALGSDALKWLSLHGLRHTHATLLLELGEHPKIVQERLGHSTIATTMNIYSHVTPTMQRAAADRLADLLASS